MWNAAARKKLITLTEQVLHVPGNYQGNILEMAMVFDGCLQPKWLADITGGLIGILRGRSEIFRNVRLNTLYWKAEGEIQKEITPMPVLQMGRYFEDKERVPLEKPVDELLYELRLYYARSKLIYVFTDGSFAIRDEQAASEAMKPFLGRKTVFITTGEEAKIKRIQPFKRECVINL